jgi:hypothetical protein
MVIAIIKYKPCYKYNIESDLVNKYIKSSVRALSKLISSIHNKVDTLGDRARDAGGKVNLSDSSHTAAEKKSLRYTNNQRLGSLVRRREM